MASDLDIQAAVVVNSEQAENAFNRVGDKAQQMANEVATSAGKAGQAVDKIGDGADKGAEKFTRAEARMREAIKKSTRELEMMGKTASQKFEANLEFKGLDKAKFQPFLNELRQAEEATKRAENGINSMSATAQMAGRAMALAFSGAAITGFLGKVVAVQREFDVLNSSLKTVTGSSAAAEREMAWLKDFAKETPFGLAQATQGFVKMKALGLDPTRAALTSFGNTASAMGKDLNQMIEAVADASTGEFERLKEFGIKAKKEGDNVSLTFQGVTTTIKNSAAEITQYLENIGNTSFGGAMEERAKTLDGTIAALGDTWDELFRTVSTNNVGGLIFDSVTLANGALEDATTILRAMGGAAQDAGRDTGALSTIQNGIATVFETVAVLGANLKFVLVGIGTEIGGLAAQVAQAAQFNFAGVRAIREQMVADAEAARREIDATTERILNARKEQEEYARYATRNASAATDPRRVDLGGSTTRKPVAGVDSKGINAANKELADQAKLIAELNGLTGSFAKEWDTLSAVYKKGEMSLEQLTSAQAALLAKQPAIKAFADEQNKAQQSLAKANLDAAASREKYLTSLSTGLDKIQADIAAQIEATERMGLSKEAIAELDAAKLEMLATDLELQAIKAMDRNLDQQTYDALKKQAAAYRELGIAKKGGAAKEAALDMEKANDEAAKKAQEDWERASEQINSTLTDALMRGFESGKGFAENLRQTVVNMFKTMVLRPVISAIISPISGALLGGLGLAGTASAGQSALSTVGSIGSGYSLLSGLGGAFGGGLAGGFGGLMGSLGLSATGSTLGGAMSAGSIALGSGNILGGLGTIAGALGPIALGIGLLSSLIKKSTPHMGAGVTYSAADGLVRGADQYSQANYGFGAAGEYNSAAESTVGAVARGIATALDSTARTFGRQAGFEISTAFADDKSKDGAWGQLAIRRNGETILDWRDTQTSRWAPREFSDGEAGLQEYQTAVAQSMREALDKMDLPGWAGDMLDALGDSPSIENLGTTLDQINAAQVALEQMGKNLVGFADYTSAAIDALVKAAGGVDSLVSAASTYYDNFYTDAEKAANVTRDVTAALADVGLQMPTTREGFRALVEQQMALGEAGAEAVAALLGVSGAFASVTQAADAAAQAAEQARESAISAAFSGLQRAVKREQEWLQARIDVASEARDALSSLFDLLHDNVQDLYGSVSSTAVQQGAQASAYIAQALATARGTGYLPETDALSDAISAARGGMDATQYANQFEADRDRLVLAGQLAELEGMAGEQLTTAERTLKELQEQNDQLEQTLEYWRDQIELSQAGVDATLSVADAIARLQDAMFPGDKPGSGSGSGSAGGAAGFGPGGITWGSQGPEAKYKTPISLATAGVGYQPVTDPEQIARLDSLSSTYHKYDGTGDLVGLLTAMREAGATTADLSALSGYFESDWRRAAESVGIPAFDVGTNRVPRDMLAVVHKDEAIIPKAYNPWANGQAMNGGDPELLAEMRAMRAELAALRAASQATANNTAGLPQMADQFDTVTNGGNAMRAKALA